MVHECVTVETGWAGPLRGDVTWHPAAIRAGLRGTLQWTAIADMTCAVEPVAFYAVAPDRFRDQVFYANPPARFDQIYLAATALLALIATRAAELA